MSRPSRTDAQLIEDSRHILYELEMLDESFRALTALKLSGEKWPRFIMNSWLETLLLHTRNLVDFACPPPSAKGTDIIAVDFIPGWEAKSTAFLDGVRTRANKEMLHLTQGRKLQGEMRSWEFGKIITGVADLLLPFIDQVPAQRVTSDFVSRARAALPNLAEGGVIKLALPWIPSAQSVATQGLGPNEADDDDFFDELLNHPGS